MFVMTIVERLDALRKLMKEQNMQAYVVPTDDFHGSEYVGDFFKTRKFLSGFTGSAGTLVVTPDWAGLWTDGRYFLQASRQLEGSTIELMKMGEPGVPTIPEYLADKLPMRARIGCDGRTMTTAFVEEIREKTDTKEMTFGGTEDLGGEVWTDRPAMSAEPVWTLDEKYTGESRLSKLTRVREKMQEESADVLVLSALDEIAWLLNLRGHDVAYTPVFLSYMIVEKDKATLCIQKQVVSEEIRAGLETDGVQIQPYDAIYALAERIPSEKAVWIDKESANYRLYEAVGNHTKVITKDSPVILMKAMKNACEAKNIREAHIKDGVAVTRFMHWLKTHAGKEKITEISAADRLEEFRKEMDGFIEQSFDSIIGYAEHGAIVHYKATEETDAEIKARGLCLADTGGHYQEGTTDITRTFALGELTAEEKKMFTLVLKGHLNLGAAQFKYGCCGQNLDYLAREPLWANGLDYNHGTGHGVGYVLNVHEGPQRIHWRIAPNVKMVPFEEGMVVSNEPGLYLTDKFGIRHENLMLCCKGKQTEFGQFMYFENLTMVPFDLDGIDVTLLNELDIARLNAYHQNVYDKISPYFEGEELEWLRGATRPIAR